MDKDSPKTWKSRPWAKIKLNCRGRSSKGGRWMTVHCWKANLLIQRDSSDSWHVSQPTFFSTRNLSGLTEVSELHSLNRREDSGSQVQNLPAGDTRDGLIPDLEGPLEKEMATHSSILARKIPWMEEHGGLQSIGSQRIVHDWATKHRKPLPN